MNIGTENTKKVDFKIKKFILYELKLQWNEKENLKIKQKKNRSETLSVDEQMKMENKKLEKKKVKEENIKGNRNLRWNTSSTGLIGAGGKRYIHKWHWTSLYIQNDSKTKSIAL